MRLLPGTFSFLDINNAIPEIQVVQEYMDREKKKNNGPGESQVIVPSMQPINQEIFSLLSEHEGEAGSRLVIVPSMQTYSREKRLRIQELTTVMNKMKEKNILEPGGDLPEKIFNLGKVIRWHKTGDPDKDYSLNDFLPELKEVLSNNSYDFDRVFISGHHGSYYGRMKAVLGGEFFNGLTVDSLKKTTQQFTCHKKCKFPYFAWVQNSN